MESMQRPVSIEEIATKAMGASRPVIGIVPTYDPNEGILRMNNHYAQAIVAAGRGTADSFRSRAMSACTSRCCRASMGSVLSGGQDISPVRYGGDITYGKLSELTPEREEVEYLLLSYAYQFDYPLLGICRGMQMINVFFGGTLYLDLEEQFDGMCAADDVPVPSEGVQTQAGGRVNHWGKQRNTGIPPIRFSVLRSERAGEDLGLIDPAAVNSMHHQGVRALPPNLAAAAYGPDGLVEGVEAKDCRFFMGVQWHPEYFVEDGGHMAPLFRALTDEARQMRCREGRCHDCLRIDREECDPNAVWPAVRFADYI